MNKPLLNWRPDLPDQRDKIFKPTLISIPEKVDLRLMCSPIESQGNVGSCHDDQTEVLTYDGWKFFKDTTLNDKLATVNPTTKELIYENPIRIVKYPFNKDLHVIEGRTVNFAVTNNHKMLIRPWLYSKSKLSKKYN